MARIHTSLLTALCLLFWIPRAQAQPCVDNEVTFVSTTQDWGSEMGWKLFDDAAQLVFTFQGVNDATAYDTTLCLSDGCYVLEMTDSYGDGWNGGTLQITYAGGTLDYALFDGDYDVEYFGINTTGCVPIVLGCTDPASVNYNPLATVNDGSCLDFQDVLAAQQIDTIWNSGPKDNRINWVIQNRGTGNPNDEFSSQAEFTQAFEEDLLLAFTLGDPGAKTPYAQYKNFFNLYAAYWPDAPSDQEWWSFQIIKGLRDELFLPWADDQHGWATWFSTTKYGGGGGAGLDRDARVGDGKMFGMGWETLLHEFSHTMPGLPDEYSSSGEWSGGNCWESGNTSGADNWGDLPWRQWVDPATPIPTPYTAAYLDTYGAFEGALTNFFGCYRPSARGCIMGAGGFGDGYGQGFCAPCIQRTICFLYKYVNVIENPQPANSTLTVAGNESITFSADILKPEPNTQKYEWFLNGKLIATGVETLEVTFGSCDSYELRLTVTDTTDLVRHDPKFEEFYPLPQETFTWHIDQTEVGSYDLQASTDPTAPDCSGEANGQIAFDFAGGLPPYAVFQNGLPAGNPAVGLEAGTYTFDVVDGNGCNTTVTENLEAEPPLAAQVCTDFENGAWTAWLASENYLLGSLDIQWSTGETGASVAGLADGNYSVTVTTGTGCSQELSFNLATVSGALAVEATVFSSSLETPNGKILLDIQGGLPPYQIQWSERLDRDVTDTNTANIAASGTTWGHLPAYGFDDDLSTKWLHFVPSNAWLSYHIPEGAVVKYYSITSADDVPGRDPKDWIFEGSNDGVTWTTLDTRTNEDFPARFLRRSFLVENENNYTYYRLYVQANHGDGSIQLQELEFHGIKTNDAFVRNLTADDRSARTGLLPGEYQYQVKDANQQVITHTVVVDPYATFEDTGLNVVQEDNCQVQVENPHPDFEYYWFSDADALDLQGIGTSFQPPVSGGYFVFAYDPAIDGLSGNKRGFSVKLEAAPLVEVTVDNVLQIIDPDPALDYHWYNSQECSTPLGSGSTFSPASGTGWYYAVAVSNEPAPAAIDPAELPGILLHMDAADLDGDGAIDQPQAPTSSLLDWYFPDGNKWSDGSWFAYRSAYQNGLGVADFATIWLQRIEENVSGYQTIFLAYEENPISFAETAPFEGLSQNIPRHETADQLFSNATPGNTLNGSTFLNGAEVDPLATPNPLAFCILGVRMTQPSNAGVFYTDTKWEGKLGELLLYQGALSDEEMVGVSEFLRRKWISLADLASPKTGVFWEDPASAHEVKASHVRLYPNPVGEVLQVEEISDEITQLQIRDMQGRLVALVDQPAGAVSFQVDRLAAGTYVLVGVDGNRQVVWGVRWVKE